MLEERGRPGVVGDGGAPVGDRALSVGIVGASGAVGAELLRLMDEQPFPVEALRLFGAGRSAGDVHEHAGSHHVVRPFAPEAVEELDVVVFATPTDVSARWVPEVVRRGVAVLDASAAFREAEDVPLLVPPLNGDALADQSGIVACPDAVVTALAPVLATFADRPGVASVDLVALLSTSAVGRSGFEELSSQVVSILNQRSFEPKRFGGQVAFNVLPLTGSAAGDTGPVEPALVRELRRVVVALPDELRATLAYVSVFCGHSVALTLRLDEPTSADEVARRLAGVPAVELAAPGAPSTLDAAARGLPLVGHVRVDPRDGRVVRLWVAFDNLRVAARCLLLTLEALRDGGHV